MEKTLNQTKNAFVCVGTVSEIELEQVNAKAKINHGAQEVACQAIKGKVVVQSDDSFTTFPIYFSSVGFDGQENRQWAMAQKMLEWNPKINGNPATPATRVRLKGEFNPFDRFSEFNNKVEFYLGYRVKSASTTNVPDEDCFNVNIDNAFVAKVLPEMNGDTETGRGVITLLCSNYNGEVYPVECVVDADAVDLITEGDTDFDAFAAGQTRTGLKFMVVNANQEAAKPVVKSTGRSFGRKRKGADPSERNTQYRNELVLCECDPMLCEKPEEETYVDENGNIVETVTMWINPETIKEALKVRKQKIEEIAREGGNKKSTSNTSNANSFSNRKAAAKAATQKAKTNADTPIVNDDEVFGIDF